MKYVTLADVAYVRPAKRDAFSAGQQKSKKFQVPMQQMHVVKTSSATLNSLFVFIAKMQGLAAGLSQNWPKSS